MSAAAAAQAELLPALLAGTDWPAVPPAEEARLHAALRGLPLPDLVALLGPAREGGWHAVQDGAYGAWIAANPGAPLLAAGWFHRGVALSAGGALPEAAAAYRQALALRPDLHEAAVNLGLVQERMGDALGALATWHAALQPVPMRCQLLNHRGRLLESRKLFEPAAQALRESLLLDPDQPDVVQHWSHLRQKAALWPVVDGSIPGLTPERQVLQTGPLGILALTDDPAVQTQACGHWLVRKVPAAPRRLSPERGYAHGRIRLGYLSSDFCQHALSLLMVETLERHDRTRFEVFGYCSSPEDGSALRRRVIAALDHHVPIGGLEDAAAAARIRQDEIDILVDLNGLTNGARLAVLRWKPAPVQATYLGFVGPVPLPELDWLICDRFVVPAEQAGHYQPRPLPLAGVYQANDSRMPALPAVSRAGEGLPDGAFVFCCFAHHHKITQAMFGTWLEILRAVPGSVLWLAADNMASDENLRRRVAEAGLAPERLVLAPRVAPPHYLARLALADLFLDSFPYNSGTVASDALRMGLPLLTLAGRAFASRMAGSLLHAAGLPELVTESAEAYRAAAIRLATSPDVLARHRAALAAGAWQRGIGDAATFTRQLEAAYESILLRG